VSAFRDAIAQGVINGMDDWVGEADWQNFAADAILESPSMQAIRDALLALVCEAERHIGAFAGVNRVPVIRRELSEYGLPESVVDWVLDDD